MQKHSLFKKSFFTMLLVLSAFSMQSFALSIGRNGTAYEENGISWQPVQLNDNNQGFTAALPGQPRSGISTPWYFVYSKHQMTDYEIHTSASERFLPPGSEADFLKSMENDIEENEYFVPITAAAPEVLYAAEIYTNDKQTGEMVKIWRQYWTADNRIYYAIVEGQNLSLAPEFFNKIVFRTH
jgi:hypothetical protein